MFVVPGERLFRSPDRESIPATVESLVVHNPPGILLLKLSDWPRQKLVPPVITPTGFITMIVVDRQPVGNKYDIVLVPAFIPAILPLILPALALELLLLHIPPVNVSLNETLVPAQISEIPVMGATGFTVSDSIVKQPVGNV